MKGRLVRGCTEGKHTTATHGNLATDVTSSLFLVLLLSETGSASDDQIATGLSTVIVDASSGSSLTRTKSISW
jgi:hypothetical protein